MACLDMRLFHSYIGAALPVIMLSHGCEYGHSSLLCDMTLVSVIF